MNYFLRFTVVLTILHCAASLHSQENTVKKSRKNDAQPAVAPEGGEKRIYKTVGDVELPLYVFSPEVRTADAKAPAVVFFFGGGWKSGNPSQFEQQCKHLAKKGLVAITVEYRVSSRHAVKAEDCVEDAKSAMRWVRGNAKELGVDPDRIAASGGSAGGHIAACTALVDGCNAESDEKEVSAMPNAMVLFNPAMALSPHEDLSKEYNKRLASGGLQGRTHGDPKEISPLAFATSKQPPCIMFFGTKDRLKEGADVFCAVSTKSGNDCSVVEYAGQGHGFFNFREKGNPNYEKTVAEMDKFFEKLGWVASQ